jgi:hypothetical protein
MSNNNPERASILARWRKSVADRLRPTTPIAGNHAAELAEFHERLNQVRALAETTSDPMRANNYAQLWRTMGEELGSIASDLDHGQISTADLPDKLQEWSELGLAYLHTKQDHSAVEKILAPDDGAAADQLSLPGGEHPYTVGIDQERLMDHLEEQSGAAAEEARTSDAAELERLAFDVAFEAASIENAAQWNQNPIDDLAARQSADRERYVLRINRLAAAAGVDLPQHLIDPATTVDDTTDGAPDHSAPIGAADGDREPGSYWSSSPASPDSQDVDQELVTRISQMTSAAESADWEAERLEDADNPAAARRVRQEAKASLREADQLSRQAGLGSIFNDDNDADADADEAPELLGESNEHDPYGLAPVTQHLSQLRAEYDAALDHGGVQGVDITLREIDAITTQYRHEDAQRDSHTNGDDHELVAARRTHLNETLYGFDLNFEHNLAERTSHEASDRPADAGGEKSSRPDADEDEADRAETVASDPTTLQESAAAPEYADASDDSAPSRDDVAAAVDTSACATAVSRAAVSADIASHNVSEAAAVHASNERADELAARSHDDQAAQDHAIERNDATVGDDSPSW